MALPLASTYLTVVVPVANVPEILSIEAKLSAAFCPLAAFTPTEKAFGGLIVTPAVLVFTVHLFDEFALSVNDAVIYGPPLGPPVGQ